MKKIVAALLVFASLTACQKSDNKVTQQGENLRNLTTEERNQDFDFLINLFKTYYGPYKYKEAKLGINIEKLANEMRAKALESKTDEEFAGYVMQFGAALRDGHVQIRIENTASGISRYKIPIILNPVAGRVLIGSITPELSAFSGLDVGDEVTSIDGKSMQQWQTMALKYRPMAVKQSEPHAVVYALLRPSYMTDLIPTSATARLVAKKRTDHEIIIDIPWTLERYNPELTSIISNQLDMSVPFARDLANVVDGHLGQMGQVDPFFVTPDSKAEYGFVKVYPSDSARKKFGLKDDEKPEIYAALYRYDKKMVLLVRQASYSQSDFSNEVYLKAYMALFNEYQEIADVLVLDQTHNPGGSYCAEFYNLFAREGDVQGVQDLHADRKWINDLKVRWAKQGDKAFGGFDTKLLETWGNLVEKAYDAGRDLSEPVPLFTGSFYTVKQKSTWTKPMLVLIDELAGSCGDMFPMLVKANKRAVLFGQNTMGLGGNVEEVGVLPNSRIRVSMTRGMFYPYHPDRGPLESEFIENNGIAPDVEYNHSVVDVRNGFVGYIDAFSQKAVELVQ